MESWINQTLNSNLDLWYFVRALFHLHELLQDLKFFLSSGGCFWRFCLCSCGVYVVRGTTGCLRVVLWLRDLEGFYMLLCILVCGAAYMMREFVWFYDAFGYYLCLIAFLRLTLLFLWEWAAIICLLFCYNVEVVCVSIWAADFYFRVSI